MVKRRRRVCLLSLGLTNSVTTVFWFMRVKSEVRLRVVAVMVVVVMRVALHRGDVCSAITIIMRMCGSPYLALLRSSGRPFILVGEAMWLASSIICPLMLLVCRHPCSLVRKVAVVATATNVMMRVVAASLGSDLSANGRRSLTGCR